MYDYVIVPYDGTETTRVGHAPAADLAWRCKGKMVMVTNSPVTDKSSKRMLKGQAMEQSGEVEYWADSAGSLAEAVVEAGKHRSNSIICIMATPHGLLKKSLDSLAQEILENATVPVVVIGPSVDLRSRLPVGRIIACLDGNPESERLMPIAAAWAVNLRLNITVMGVVGPNGEGTDKLSIDYLKDHAFDVAARIEVELADIPFGLPTANAELIEADPPDVGIVGVADEEFESIVALCRHSSPNKGKGPVGDVAIECIKKSTRPLLLVP